MDSSVFTAGRGGPLGSDSLSHRCASESKRRAARSRAGFAVSSCERVTIGRGGRLSTARDISRRTLHRHDSHPVDRRGAESELRPSGPSARRRADGVRALAAAPQAQPARPHWPDRDRFVLSAGHGSMLLYSLLHLTGYDLTLEDLKAFRQWGSRTPGHPEFHLTPGRRGDDRARSARGRPTPSGMAIAERLLAPSLQPARATTIVDHRTFCLVGDGDLMEGISSEAGSLAGHLKLGKLVYLYDDNHVTLDGPDVAGFTEDVLRALRGLRLADAARRERQHRPRRDRRRDPDARSASRSARRSSPSARRSATALRTRRARAAAHGSPLGPEEVALTKKALGWEWTEPFYHVRPEALRHFRSAVEQRREGRRPSGSGASTPRRRRLPSWPSSGALAHEGSPAAGLGRGPSEMEAGGRIARDARRRRARPSTRSRRTSPGCSAATRTSRSRPRRRSRATRTSTARPGRATTSTTACASTRWPASPTAWRITAASVRSSRPSSASPTTCGRRCGSRRSTSLSTIFVWTHDSIGLGEDGPTHQAVEQLMSLRAMPDFSMIRPGDANETAEAWRAAMEHRDGAVRPRALPPEPARARPLGREGRRLARARTSSPRPRAESRG